MYKWELLFNCGVSSFGLVIVNTDEGYYTGSFFRFKNNCSESKARKVSETTCLNLTCWPKSTIPPTKESIICISQHESVKDCLRDSVSRKIFLVLDAWSAASSFLLSWLACELSRSKESSWFEFSIFWKSPSQLSTSYLRVWISACKKSGKAGKWFRLPEKIGSAYIKQPESKCIMRTKSPDLRLF